MVTTDTPIYCLRCKKHTTNTAPPEAVTTEKGRPMLRAECTECGAKKSRFTARPK